jgi:4-aminobutyrate aminotransferase-like enzyme/Ser/Thr protein kinase RdoA (MazF antagonist)
MNAVTPKFTIEELSTILSEQYSLSGELTELPSYIDQNRLLHCASGEKFIVKIANKAELKVELDMQNAAMSVLSEKGIAVPFVKNNNNGESITDVTDQDGQVCYLRVLSFLPGVFYADSESSSHTQELWSSLGQFIGQVSNGLVGFEHAGAYRYFDWDLAHGYRICQSKKSLLSAEQIAIVDHFLNEYQANTAPLLSELPKSVIHNDANDYNLLVDNKEAPSQITGLIDFGDMVYSHTINELAITCAYALMDQQNWQQTLTSLVSAYHQQKPLLEKELDVLVSLISLRLCTSVCNAAAAIKAEPDNEYLLVSVRPAWQLLNELKKVNLFALTCQIKAACGLNPDAGKAKDDIIDFRKKHLGKTLSLSFKEPLKIVRGQGAYLYDEQGNAYLDMVNNVCHVGHCHPKVVAAGQQQMAKLNTNTRFLHDNLVNYAEKLLATMPDKLSVCMFVNSGSEANELAFRLAKNFTGSKQLLTVEGAYHGNTSACINASPYKFDGPGGEGAEDYVHKVMLPDPYRGQYNGMGRDTAENYAEDVQRAINELAEQNKKPGMFICESLQGVAGQIIMPEGYLQSVYQKVRAAGGVCIADEVQVGFGRVGTHMWAFETQDVVPDIVTLGKPIGNGHPMAAVITTQEIADAFVTGMEYFNTFGGNPVSCAIGAAVLDVIQQEGLRENALETGNYLQAQLKELAKEFDIIGDVRGMGLFIGAEMVTDRANKTPATQQTADICEFLKREKNIILSTEGKFYNILKIKPPIVFDKSDADKFIAGLRAAIEFVQ